MKDKEKLYQKNKINIKISKIMIRKKSGKEAYFKRKK